MVGRKLQHQGKTVSDRLYEHAKTKQMHMNLVSSGATSNQNVYYHSQM